MQDCMHSRIVGWASRAVLNIGAVVIGVGERDASMEGGGAVVQRRIQAAHDGGEHGAGRLGGGIDPHLAITRSLYSSDTQS